MAVKLAKDEKLVGVVVLSPLDRLYTYIAPKSCQVGARVMIPFGPRKVLGIVWEESADAGEFKVKKVHEVVDESPLVTEPLRGLASFMRDYYCHPLGDVLKTMLPAIEKKKKKTYVELTAKGEEVLAGPSSP